VELDKLDEIQQEAVDNAVIALKLHMLKQQYPEYEYLTEEDYKTWEETGYLRPKEPVKPLDLGNLIDDNSSGLTRTQYKKLFKKNKHGSTKKPTKRP
jgi:hypothetical protein